VEALSLPITVNGVRLSAEGESGTRVWQTCGITCVVELDSDGDVDQVGDLLRRVDEVAEIPRETPGLEVPSETAMTPRPVQDSIPPHQEPTCRGQLDSLLTSYSTCRTDAAVRP
jgi:hypothetical protein